MNNEMNTAYLLRKDRNGQFPFPNMPSGVLPFYVANNKIIWGCVETNRVRVIAFSPPAGTQDLIITKDKISMSLEVSKPLRDLGLSFLKDFVGKPLTGTTYQEVVEQLLAHNFEVSLEDPIATAIHETYEEHGVDLRKDEGKDHHLLINLFDFEPQTVQAKRGTTTQKIVAAFLKGKEGIELKETKKEEEKIRDNKGRKFYEKGVWGSLEDFKQVLADEKIKYQNATAEALQLTPGQFLLIQQELVAFESRIQLLEKVERSIAEHLKLDTTAQLDALDFKSLQEKTGEHKSAANFPGLQFLSSAKKPPQDENDKPTVTPTN